MTKGRGRSNTGTCGPERAQRLPSLSAGSWWEAGTRPESSCLHDIPQVPSQRLRFLQPTPSVNPCSQWTFPMTVHHSGTPESPGFPGKLDPAVSPQPGPRGPVSTPQPRPPGPRRVPPAQAAPWEPLAQQENELSLRVCAPDAPSQASLIPARSTHSTVCPQKTKVARHVCLLSVSSSQGPRWTPAGGRHLACRCGDPTGPPPAGRVCSCPLTRGWGPSL